MGGITRGSQSRPPHPSRNVVPPVGCAVRLHWIEAVAHKERTQQMCMCTVVTTEFLELFSLAYILFLGVFDIQHTIITAFHKCA